MFDVGQSGRHVPGFCLSHVRDEVHFGFRLIDGTTANTIALEALSKGEWRHLAGVSSAQGMTIYVDGAPATWMPDHFRPDSFADYIDTALVGYSRWAGSYDYVLGMFDEMRVWNVARTQEQIVAAMHTPLVGNEPGLLVYHPLDETTGDVLIDVTGNGYDGDRSGTARQPSGAPLIEMSSIALVGADGIPVDVTGDSVPGGIVVSTFIVDTTPPRVVSIDPDLIECDTVVAVPTLTIGFDDEMDAATLVAANADLIRSGGDGTFDDGNEVQIALTDPQYDAVAGAATFSLDPPIPDDTYRFRLMDQVQSITGAALDGEFPGLGGPTEPLPSGDGTPGGEFVIGFIVDSTQDCNNSGTADICELRQEGEVSVTHLFRAFIDDHDYLIIQGATVRWHHFAGGAAPGRHGDGSGNEPTLIDSVEWYPEWPEDPPAPIGYEADSSVYVGLSPRLPTQQVDAQLNIIAARDLLVINQLPSEENNYTLIIEVDDPSAGAFWYEFELVVTYVLSLDCNTNDILDECDIADETSDDCNENGIPDECEPDGNDCNGNDVPDDCEPDCNENGLADDCDLDGNDWNENGIPDDCEGPAPVVLDWWGSRTEVSCVYSSEGQDARLDNCTTGYIEGVVTLLTTDHWELDFAVLPDEWSGSDLNDYVDIFLNHELIGRFFNSPRAVETPVHAEVFGDSFEYRFSFVSSNSEAHAHLKVLPGRASGWGDCNNNGILDQCDIADETSDDCNENGRPDECEPQEDCNTNTVQDICDIFDGTSLDCNSTGIPDECELSDNDCNANGVPDECEDCNGNGLADECDIDAGTSYDCNGNRMPDECEPDCNDNDITDECDIRDGTSYDFDDNGVPDECQPDCNDNGFPDFLDIAFTYSLDCNTNAIPDECDVDDGTSSDCNTNDVPDECDVADGTSDDCNDNIVPDECEPDADNDGIPDQCDQKGDFDHDVDADLDDYQVFWDCLFLSGPGDPPPFSDCLDAFDFDVDEDVDLRDLAAFAKTFAGARQRGR